MKINVKQNMWWAYGALCGLAFALPVHAASFDCAKASTKVEHIICDNPEISKLDDQLAEKYKEALKDKTRSKTIMRTQRAWIIQRNKCAREDCVKQVYEKRLASSDFEPASSSANTNVERTSANSSGSTHSYRFQLTKGKGIPVCDAYLKRLNTTKFVSPPYCGRAERTSVPGFAFLNRVPLSAEAVHAIFPRVNKFVLSGKQGSKKEDEAYEALVKGRGGEPSIEPVSNMKEFIQKGEMKVWRYLPQVDVDNDGAPDNVLMWQGYGLRTPTGVCGRTVAYTHITVGPRQPQLAFVLSKDGNRIDIPKTKNIFGKPGGYRLPGGEMLMGFRPIGGESIGIFEYQGDYYFDTFFEPWGDQLNNQRAEKLVNTLGVFFNKEGKTKQICEYRMNDLNSISGESGE
jgi:uncharacterized protein YecT (DUF1311 family)